MRTSVDQMGFGIFSVAKWILAKEFGWEGGLGIKRMEITEYPIPMLSHLEGALPRVRRARSRIPRNPNKTPRRLLDTVLANLEDKDGQPESDSKQLVLYKPGTSNTGQNVLAVPDCSEDHTGSFQNFSVSNPSSKVLPSVGAFTVQCAVCFKWRLIPTKEKYEEIRETILQEPFVCDQAREWRPNISCDDPADISQDGSRLWAIDKPNIAQPPPGWERILRIRGEGSTKFADIYYAAPSGKRLRSMVEIQKYLLEHPEFIRNGVNLSQFSFQIPKPLQENYVRKRPARMLNPCDGAGLELSRPLEPCQVNPLSWAGPPTRTELELGGPGLSTCSEPPVYQPPVVELPPAKKAARYHGISMHEEPNIETGDLQQTRNASSCEL